MPYVFGYASLVSPDSLEATLGRSISRRDGPFRARLNGARRAWNVTGHVSAREDYEFHDADGTPWSGWITFLGLEDAPGESTLGAFYRVTRDDLSLLDGRERSYDRVDIVDRLEPLEWMPSGEPVEVYWPRAAVVAEAQRVGTARTVMARYLRLIDDAYQRLGPEFYREHLRTMPDLGGCRVEEVQATPVSSAAGSYVVDPQQGTGRPKRP